jgi:hypothetical protein
MPHYSAFHAEVHYRQNRRTLNNYRFYSGRNSLPLELKTKTDWAKQGRKITGEPSAIFRYYKDKTTYVYPIEATAEVQRKIAA